MEVVLIEIWIDLLVQMTIPHPFLNLLGLEVGFLGLSVGDTGLFLPVEIPSDVRLFGIE